MTTFVKPQWVFKKARNRDVYGTLRNAMHIRPGGRSKERVVPVDIPTEFFRFARDVLKIVEFRPDALFYLEKDNSRWYLGFDSGHDRIDLWYYTKSTLPDWAKL